ncbi:Large-conductance mechanosensitive channel [Minicystis rosea]|nr:Large-conductance mechanosensitive channel [Minicystis rosea]
MRGSVLRVSRRAPPSRERSRANQGGTDLVLPSGAGNGHTRLAAPSRRASEPGHESRARAARRVDHARGEPSLVAERAVRGEGRGVHGGDDLLSGFKKFLLRGNVVDLAVGVAIGAAFNALVTSFGASFIKPILGLLIGGGIEGGKVAVGGQVFDVGGFINAVITFLITATALYFIVVVPLETLTRRLRRAPEPDAPMRECPECLSRVPAAARRCMHCTSMLTPP